MQRGALLLWGAVLCLTPRALLAQDDAGQPAAEYQRAARLFGAGQREEAVYWFYRGQMHARIEMAAHPDMPEDAGPALYASLNDTVGRPINEWAFGDVPAVAATIDKVLADDAAEDGPASLRRLYPAADAEVTAGLAQLQGRIVADQAAIAAQRRANGLPNRGR